MRKNFKKTIKEDIENLICDVGRHSLTEWEFCQALKSLIDKWERKIDEEIFSEFDETYNCEVTDE